MAAPQELWRQFWIFQANPKQYNAKTQLRVGQDIDWYVSRFIDRYRDGDIIYLWIAGDEAGVYGWAEVQGEVFKDEQGKQRLKAVYRGVLKTPLLRPFLRNQPKVFDGLSILRNPTGANFRVTVLEAIELNRLMRENGEQVPPDPDEMEDPNARGEMYTKAVYVLDYRFDNDVKRIISSCLATSQNINQTFFPGLMIQVPLIYYASLLQHKSPPDFALALDEVIPIGKLQRQLTFAEQIVLDDVGQLSPEMASQVMVKRNVLIIIAEARRIAIKTTGKERIMARHLFGALLQGAVAPVQNYIREKILEPVGFKLDEVRDNFVNLVTRMWPEDKLDAWGALVKEELIPIEAPETFSPLLTRIDSDSADEASRDLLNIDDDAIAIAKVLCAKDAAPPLAIGLFGEWGSGKTFFMRRIFRHVNALTDRVSITGGDSGQAYQSKVAQIWFNAWNYQDGKLWASLVNHVFVGLKQELKRLNADSADEEFKALMKRLDEDRILEKRLQSSSARLNSLEKQQAEIGRRIETLNAANKAIQSRAPEEKRRIQSVNELKKYGKEIETVFGVQGADQTLTSVIDNIDKTKAIIDKISHFGILSRLYQAFRFFTRDGKTTIQSILSILLVVAICYGLISYDIQWGSVGSAITLAVGFVSTRLTKFGQFLKLVNTIKRDFENASQDSSDEIQEKLNRNSKELQKLQMQKLEVQAEIKTSQKDFDRLNANYGDASDETFASFIFDRAASSDYKSHLGLINTVRRDFSRLNKLLTQQQDASLPKIDRIVLYIDDLDRCESEIVVDVLQAIHLMLAFPLFMVVVGVDARWLGRSLKKRYSFLVHEKDDKNNEELDYHAASTHDYLEKIFQIPFWLKRLDGHRANAMMKALLENNRDSKTDEGLDKKDSNQTQNETQNVNDENLSSSNLSIMADDGVNKNQDDELFEESEDQAEGYTDLTADDELLINNLISTRSLEMSEAELAFFQQLGAIVGRSPRAVKRFINLYRILKASHKKARVVGFSDDKGEFQVPLFLLAVVCGSPKEAELLFRFLKAQPDELTLNKVLQSCESDSSNEGWSVLVSHLNACMEVIGGLNVHGIKTWIPEVARFSYREWVE